MRQQLSLFVWLAALTGLLVMPSPPDRSAQNGQALAAGESGASVPESAAIQAAAQVPQDQEALSGLQSLIGGWKGVGQPRRASAQGAWPEDVAWAWNFEEGRAAVVFTTKGSRYFTSGRIVPGTEPGELVLYVRLSLADDSQNDPLSSDGQADSDEGTHGFAQSEGEQDPHVVYRGQFSEGRWVFTRAEAEPMTEPNMFAAGGAPARLTFRLVAEGKRLVVLLERRLGESDQFARLAEIGYTRKGSRFGHGGGVSPECIVTGGLGTIAVEYKGQTYYVCCTGCRDYFLDQPEEVLAQYRHRIEHQHSSP